MISTPAQDGRSTERRTTYEVQLDRHEAKYVIPRSLVPKIREFIAPFCQPDSHGQGDPPEYVITTLQLDSAGLALHEAKGNEALNRFKLRVRTYGNPGDSAVFMEVKRNLRGTIVKSRTRIPFDAWGEHLLTDPKISLQFRTDAEVVSFLEFRRLVQEIGAKPVTLIRYTRESYFGTLDQYARVTFDRKLMYQPTASWESWGRGGRWIPLDSSLVQNKQYPFSGVVLELKTLSEAPRWMIDLIMEFGLERTGHCKYSNAVWLESLFLGWPDPPSYAGDLLVL